MEEAVQTMAIEELGYSNLRVKQKEAILHYLQGKEVFVCSQLVLAKLLLVHIASSNIKSFSKQNVYCHCCQSSGSADLALLSTASQVVESKVYRQRKDPSVAQVLEGLCYQQGLT